jgi:DNA polymerase elongation subunit (family B)
MSKFYSNVHLYRNEILLRGYEDGKRIQEIIPYKPYLFLPATEETPWRTLDGKFVSRIDFDTPSDARDFTKRYEDVSNFDIYGFTNYVYPFINDRYSGEIDYDPKQLSVVNIDIEVAADQGFPNIQTADKEVTAITMKKDDIYVVLGCGVFDKTKLEPSLREKVKYIKCKDEEELLMKFLDVWCSNWFSPDIVTGWNIEFFDIPYMYNRIKRILGTAMAKKLSPWNLVEERTAYNSNGQENTVYIPAGIAMLDYLQLYKKFSFTMQESYRLDHIAHIELGERKLDYSEYESLFGLYKNNYQLFIEYNIKDVDLVDRLDDKLKFIEQVMAIAYDGKVNFVDAFTSVRLWDVIIHNYLINQRIVVPQNKRTHKDKQIIGAYVKDPQTGMHEWVVSFDLNSLYPHLIMQYNISPETFVGQHPNINGESGLEKILAGFLNENDLKEKMIEKNITCSASGCFFDKDRQGFLPKLMEKMYNDRVVYKDRMIAAKKDQEINPSDENIKLIARNHNMQLAKKIQLNSAYGALSNEYFRWYDDKLAESITISGQLSIKWIEQKINAYMNKLIKTNNVDYVIASDTDSIYVKMGSMVDGLKDMNLTEIEIVQAIDTFCEKKMTPFIDKAYEELAEYVNAYSQKMAMKREAIASKGIWTAKKRYILNVWNNEGVQYAEPKLKMMGIEAVRSSTPMACRTNIKKAMGIIMNKDEDAIIEFINTFRSEFNKLPFEDVAFPRGCNGLKKYADKVSIYASKTPIQVRGALLYNDMLKKQKLTSRYPLIQDGDKIKFCYLRTPNPLRENVIACQGNLPKQLDLDKYIDYDMQYQKSFVEPIKTILDAIGWQVEKQGSLENFWS